MKYHMISSIMTLVLSILFSQPIFCQVQMRCKDCDKVFKIPKSILRDNKLALALDAISKQTTTAEVSLELREILSAFGANENFNRIKLQNNSICKAIHCLREDPEQARRRINLLFDKVFGTYNEWDQPEIPSPKTNIFPPNTENREDLPDTSYVEVVEDTIMSGKLLSFTLSLGEKNIWANCSCSLIALDKEKGQAKFELAEIENPAEIKQITVIPGEIFSFKECNFSYEDIKEEATVLLVVNIEN